MQGRPSTLFSIHRRGQGLELARVFDQSALRVIAHDVADCRRAVRPHEVLTPVPGEFDDYIARPKPNGYQSLHTVVRDAAGKGWRYRFAPAPCTNTPSTAWRRTGPA